MPRLPDRASYPTKCAPTTLGKLLEDYESALPQRLPTNLCPNTMHLHPVFLSYRPCSWALQLTALSSGEQLEIPRTNPTQPLHVTT